MAAAPRSAGTAVMRWAVPVTLALLWAGVGSASADVPAAALSRDAAVNAFVAQWADDEGPGFAWAAMHDGAVVTRGARGLASVEHVLPLTPDSRFNAASIAKPFTAWAVLDLVEGGGLALDDTVESLLPGRFGFDDAVTVERLLQHTGGLQDYWALSALAGIHPGDLITQQHALAQIARVAGTPAFTPGSRHGYSNSGYIVLAELVRERSGSPLAERLATRLFEPLGMQASVVIDSPRGVVPGLAEAYETRRDVVLRTPLQSGVHGSGNLVTTVDDLLRWSRWLLDADGGAEWLERLRGQPHFDALPAPGYGRGVQVGRHGDAEAVWHSGANAGYRGYWLLLPETGTAVAVLANHADVPVERVARGLADLVLADGAVAVDPGDDDGPRVAVPAGPDEAEAARYEGLYLLETGVLFSVRWLRGGLHLMMSGTPVALEPVAEHRFTVAGDDAELAFELDTRGEVNVARLHLPEATLRADPQTPARKRRRALRDYAGEWYSDALGVAWTLAPDDDGRLVIERRRAADFRVRPLRENLFVEWETGDLRLRFERDFRGRARTMYVSVDRARDIEFTRR